jgi:hypothetical protein
MTLLIITYFRPVNRINYWKQAQKQWGSDVMTAGDDSIIWLQVGLSDQRPVTHPPAGCGKKLIRGIRGKTSSWWWSVAGVPADEEQVWSSCTWNQSKYVVNMTNWLTSQPGQYHSRRVAKQSKRIGFRENINIIILALPLQSAEIINNNIGGCCCYR